MIATLFLIIAYFRKGKFLPKDSPWWLTCIYYGECLAFTPFIGPYLFALIFRPRNLEDGQKGMTVFPNMNLF